MPVSVWSHQNQQIIPWKKAKQIWFQISLALLYTDMPLNDMFKCVKDKNYYLRFDKMYAVKSRRLKKTFRILWHILTILIVFRLSFVNLQRAKIGTHMFDAKYRYVFVV